MSNKGPLHYEKGALDADGIQRLVEKYWKELLNSHEEQKKLGIKLDPDRHEVPFSAAGVNQGVGLGEAGILISIHLIGSLTYDVCKKIWRDYLLRKIKSRGEDNIGNEKND